MRVGENFRFKFLLRLVVGDAIHEKRRLFSIDKTNDAGNERFRIQLVFDELLRADPPQDRRNRPSGQFRPFRDFPDQIVFDFRVHILAKRRCFRPFLDKRLVAFDFIGHHVRFLFARDKRIFKTRHMQILVY